MKVVCLGGAGAMTSSFLYDLHKTSDFDDGNAKLPETEEEDYPASAGREDLFPLSY